MVAMWWMTSINKCRLFSPEIGNHLSAGGGSEGGAEEHPDLKMSTIFSQYIYRGRKYILYYTQKSINALL